MFLLVLLTVLLYQQSIMSNSAPQYLLLAVLLLLYKRNMYNIKFSDETNCKIIIPEKNFFINSCSDNDTSVLNTENLPSVNYDTYEIQKTNDDIADYSVLGDFDDEADFEATNTEMNSRVSRHHYYDTRIYHNKKTASSKYKDKTQRINDDASDFSPVNPNISTKTHFYTEIREKESRINSYEDVPHNKKVSADGCKINKIDKGSEDSNDIVKLKNNSGNEVKAVKNKISTSKKAKYTSDTSKEKVYIKKSSNSKKTVSNIINKKYLGNTISIIFGDFGLITGTVIFIDNTMTGLKLENGIEIYLNNNNIKGYY